VIPFQLPPPLARLHDLLEGLHEQRERGLFLSEHDRPGDPRGRPLLMHLAAGSMSGARGPGRHAPDWIAEALDAGQESERLARYAAAGVTEYWLVFPGEVVVCREPRADGSFGQRRTYRGQERIESAAFPDLELTAAILLG